MMEQKKQELTISQVSYLLLKAGIKTRVEEISKFLVDHGVVVTCGGCDSFMGGFDFGKCCKQTYYLKDAETEACEKFNILGKDDTEQD